LADAPEMEVEESADALETATEVSAHAPVMMEVSAHVPVMMEVSGHAPEMMEVSDDAPEMEVALAPSLEARCIPFSIE